MDVANEVVWLSVVLYPMIAVLACHSTIRGVPGLSSWVGSSETRGWGYTVPGRFTAYPKVHRHLDIPGYNRACVTVWRHVQFRENAVERGEGSACYSEDDPWGCGGPFWGCWGRH
jgi:hypothetical protein